MNKFSFIALWDVYGNLLTSVQQEITDLYFNLDLTVSEIAEQKGITRQAVSECLKGCKKQLEDYEEKLHLRERFGKMCLENSFLLTQANRWAENFIEKRPEFLAEMQELKEILNRDYSADVESALQDPEFNKLYYKDYTAEVFKTGKTGEE